MNFNHYQNLGWNLWLNTPYWNALATHNAYYYYQSAKAALSSQYQTTMVRKGGGTKRPYSNGRLETVPALPPATHRGDDFSSETSLTQFGIKNCPECHRIFEESNRSVLENCMHVKCRKCFIEHSEGCLQCRNEAESERPKKALRSALTSSPSVSSTIFQTRKGPTPTAFGSSTQVAFPVTISTLIGQNAPPPGKATRSTTLRSTTNSNGSTAEPTNHSNFTIAPGTSKVHPSRRPPDPPSPPLQVLPKIRQTYGKASATNKAPSRGAVPVQGHSGLNSTFTHSNNESSSPAVSRTNGTAGPSTSFQQTKHVHAQVVANGASTSSPSRTVSCTSSGPTRYAEPTRIPPSSMPMPSPDAENEPEPDSILGDLNLDTAPSTENRASKKKRHPVHIHDHISIVSGDPLLYQCNVCMKKFKTKAHIKYHEFCQNGEKPYKCEQCGQGFIAKSHYEYHIRTHTGERPYVCPKCGKGFNQRGKVTRHMRSHTGEKPFVCQQCGRGFANAQAMRSHFLIHTGERPFACEFCDKRFTGMTNLKKHVITHTGERPFQCSHCGKSFGLKWTLDLHLRTHSSERPYACEQCSRAFSNSKDLRRHMVIHSGERPFKCWICGTAFRRKDNLDRHIKNTHNQTREVAKQLANEAAAEYLASSNSASSASTSTSTTPSQASTPKPATVSRAPAEKAPPVPESSNKAKVLPKPGTSAQTRPVTPLQPVASTSATLVSTIKIEGSTSNLTTIATKHSSSTPSSPLPKTSTTTTTTNRMSPVVTTVVVNPNRMSPAVITAANSTRASTPTAVINSNQISPAPTAVSANRMSPAPTAVSSSRTSPAPTTVTPNRMPSRAATVVNSIKPISAPKSTQQSGSSKLGTPPSTRSTRSSSSKTPITTPTNGTSTKHSSSHGSSSKIAKIAHSNTNATNALPASSATSSPLKSSLKSSTLSTQNNRGLEQQSSATTLNPSKRPRSPLPNAVVITAEVSPSSSPTFARENDTDIPEPFLHSVHESELIQNVLPVVEVKEEGREVECFRVEVLTELRTILPSEYPLLDAVKFLESSKSSNSKKRKLNGTTMHSDTIELVGSKVLETVDFKPETETPKGETTEAVPSKRIEVGDLKLPCYAPVDNVTIIYGDSGQTSFIHENSQFPDGCDVSDDESTSILDIPKESLFDFSLHQDAPPGIEIDQGPIFSVLPSELCTENKFNLNSHPIKNGIKKSEVNSAFSNGDKGEKKPGDSNVISAAKMTSIEDPVVKPVNGLVSYTPKDSCLYHHLMDLEDISDDELFPTNFMEKESESEEEAGPNTQIPATPVSVAEADTPAVIDSPKPKTQVLEDKTEAEDPTKCSEPVVEKEKSPEVVSDGATTDTLEIQESRTEEMEKQVEFEPTTDSTVAEDEFISQELSPGLQNVNLEPGKGSPYSPLQDESSHSSEAIPVKPLVLACIDTLSMDCDLTDIPLNSSKSSPIHEVKSPSPVPSLDYIESVVASPVNETSSPPNIPTEDESSERDLCRSPSPVQMEPKKGDELQESTSMENEEHKAGDEDEEHNSLDPEHAEDANISVPHNVESAHDATDSEDPVRVPIIQIAAIPVPVPVTEAELPVAIESAKLTTQVLEEKTEVENPEQMSEALVDTKKQALDIDAEGSSIEPEETQEPANNEDLEQQIESSTDRPDIVDDFTPQEFSLGLQDVNLEPGKDYPYSPMQDEPLSPELSPVKSLVLGCIDTLSMDCDISDVSPKSGKSSPIHQLPSPSSIASLNDMESEIASPVKETDSQLDIPTEDECSGSDVSRTTSPVQVEPPKSDEPPEIAPMESEEAADDQNSVDSEHKEEASSNIYIPNNDERICDVEDTDSEEPAPTTQIPAALASVPAEADAPAMTKLTEIETQVVVEKSEKFPEPLVEFEPEAGDAISEGSTTEPVETQDPADNGISEKQIEPITNDSVAEPEFIPHEFSLALQDVNLEPGKDYPYSPMQDEPLSPEDTPVKSLVLECIDTLSMDCDISDIPHKYGKSSPIPVLTSPSSDPLLNDNEYEVASPVNETNSQPIIPIEDECSGSDDRLSTSIVQIETPPKADEPEQSISMESEEQESGDEEHTGGCLCYASPNNVESMSDDEDADSISSDDLIMDEVILTKLNERQSERETQIAVSPVPFSDADAPAVIESVKLQTQVFMEKAEAEDRQKCTEPHIEQKTQTLNINSDGATAETLETREASTAGIFEKQIESSSDCPAIVDEIIPEELPLGLQDVNLEPGRDYPYSPMQDEPPSPEVSPVKALVLDCIDTLSTDRDISDVPHKSPKSSPIQELPSPAIPSSNYMESEVTSSIHDNSQPVIPPEDECYGSDVRGSTSSVQIQDQEDEEEFEESTPMEMEVSDEEQNSLDPEYAEDTCYSNSVPHNVEMMCDADDADSDSSVRLTIDCPEASNRSSSSSQPRCGSEKSSEGPGRQRPLDSTAHSPISDAGSSELELFSLYNDPVYALNKQQASSGGSRSSSSPTSQVSTSDMVFSIPEQYPSQNPIPGMNDSNIRIIYATASAHAEEGDEEAGIPRKVRLLYAEALGYGGNPTEPLQLVYAAARPNQQFVDSDPRVVETIPPRYVSTPPDWNYSGDRVQDMFSQQKPTYSEPLSMEVVAGSGSAISQCYLDYPENLSLVSRAQSLPGLIPQAHIDNQRDVMNAFQYGNLETSAVGDARASAYHDHSLYSTRKTGSYDGMSLLATAAAYRTAEERAVERANLAWDAADRARVTAAQAIATVGLAARLQREREIMERSNMTPSPSLSDNVPSPPSSDYHQSSSSRYHRGPRKHYLSQPRTD